MALVALAGPTTGLAAVPDARAAAAPAAERCVGCHAPLMQGRVVHGALQMDDCTACHSPVTKEAGKCRSRTASKWSLAKAEPDLCYGCHDRKDKQKSVHGAIKMGSCLACHAAHASDNPGLTKLPREKLCFECHEVGQLLKKPVKHAPVAEGRCLDCHDPHGGDAAYNLRREKGSAACLKCHDAKAPAGAGTPGAAFRIDLTKKVTHPALDAVDCLGCHEAGHGSDNLRLLKKSVASLCYDCHDRKDGQKYTHGAVALGDCAVCHDPHSSDNAHLLARPTLRETCFLCHQDDLTGRKVVHAPVAKGCDQCHDPHGGQSRFALKFGEGKATCYRCHKPVDGGKVKHPALERYGCTACHDPHGADHGALLGKQVNALCTSCHPGEQDGRHVTPIAAGGHPVGGNLNDPRRPGRDFSCASCHDPHGSDNPRLFYFGESAMASCDGCHGDKSGKNPQLKDITPRAIRKAAVPAAKGAGGAGSGSGSSGGGGGR